MNHTESSAPSYRSQGEWLLLGMLIGILIHALYAWITDPDPVPSYVTDTCAANCFPHISKVDDLGECLCAVEDGWMIQGKGTIVHTAQTTR